MNRLILFLVAIGGVSELGLALVKLTRNETTIGYYIDIASIVLVAIGVVLLTVIVPRASRKSFRQITLLIAVGFLFQLVYMFIWYYYQHLAVPSGVPAVSIGDFFYFGSYVLWAGATLPYLKRYGNLMSSNSRLMLAAYSILAGVVIIWSTPRLYDASLSYGYNWFETGVWLAYTVVPLVCIFLFLAIALLYHYDRYGKGLLRYYWLYFMLPIGFIAAADTLGAYYYIAYNASVPGQYSDALYLLAYSTVIASCATILKSDLREVSMEPSRSSRVGPTPTDLIEGRGYILEDPTSARSFEVFGKLLSDKVGGGVRSGYVLSRQHPTQIRAKYGLENTRITWIATTVGESVIEPTKVTMIAHSVMEYLANSKNGLVLLDGLESIIVNNDLNRSLRMLEQINDFVMQYRGLLLVPIDPSAFEPRERANLIRNFALIPASESSVRDLTGGSPVVIGFSGH